VYVGLGLEGKLEDVLAKQDLPRRQVVSFADAVGIKAEHDHDHGDHADHDHEHAVDPHLWLNPVLVDALVPALAQAVLNAEKQRGRDAEAVLQRLDAAALALRGRIDGVDKAWGEGLMPFRGQAVVTHHNAFSRPAERYGFKVAAVIKQFEDEPTPGDIAKVVSAIRAEGVKAIFVEPQYNPASARRIAELAGVKVGTLDPIGDGDWFALMQKNLDSLVEHMGGGGPAPASGGRATELK
jgi:ABC-type Zn uptake system ZnuABC Zn-binding protein ZnuA